MLAGWIYILIDSIFRIQSDSEWVFQQIIFCRNCFYSVNENEMKDEMVLRGLNGWKWV